MSAGNIKLNLKEFKHIKSDKNSTTLQHKNGHQLVLHHPSLSKESQAQLKHLAEGGKPHYDEGGGVMASIRRSGWAGEAAQDTQKADDVKASPHTTTIHSTGTAGPSQQQAEGGKIHMEEGGGVIDKVKEFMSPIFHKAEDDQQKYQDPRSRPIFNGTLELPKKQQKAEGGYIKEIHPDKDEPGYTEKMAQGGQPGASAYDLHLPCLNPNCKSHGRPHPNCRCYGMAKGGRVDNLRYCAHGMPHMEGCEYAKGGKTGEAPAMLREDLPEEQPNDVTAVPTEVIPDSSPVPEAQHGPQGIGSNLSMDSMRPYLGPGWQKQPEAPQDAASSTTGDQEKPQNDDSAPQQPQAQAESQDTSIPDVTPGKQAAIQQQQAQQNDPVQRFQNHKAAANQYYLSEDQDWANDLRNGHITPQTYEGLFADKNTPGKIGTLFGMLLSGFGSGLSHQPNMVLNMMQQTIANDMTAQQNSKVNAENYLRLSQQHEMTRANAANLNAETAIKTNALAMMKANRAALQIAAANVNKYPEGSPERLKAQQVLAVLNDSVQNENYRLADRAATAQAYYQTIGAGVGTNQADNNEAAFQQKNKALQSGMMGEKGKAVAQYDADRHIPNTPPHISGHATNPVPQDIKNQLHVQNVLDNKGKELLSFIHQHSGTWNPQTIALAKQKVEEMKNFYNGSIEGGQLTAGRLKWYDEQFKENPTSLVNQYIHGSTKRLEEVVNSNAMRRDQQYKDLGYNVGTPKVSGQKIERFDPKTGKTAVFDSNKKFLNWK